MEGCTLFASCQWFCYQECLGLHMLIAFHQVDAVSFNSSIDADLSSVAQRFQANESDILWYSQLDASTAPSSGQPLRIPFPCGCEDSFLWHNFSYIVQSNDLAINIAGEKYGFLITSAAMSSVDGDLNFIYPNNVLTIPVSCSCGDPNVNSSYGLFLTYIAQANDNAAALSQKFNVSVDLLQRYNRNINLDLLQESVSILFVPAQDGNGVYPPFNFTGLGSSNSNTKAIVGASVGAVVFLLAMTGAGLLYVCIYCPKKHREATEMVKYPLQSATVSPGPARPFSEGSAYSNATNFSGLSYFSPDGTVEFSYKELSDATDNFSNANKIGQGGYGSVFYGELHGQKLAIKMMNMQATKEFLAELQVLTRVHHTNLVRLVGYCTHESLFLVYEYVENGTLSQHLKYSVREGTTPLSWEARIQVALDAARGLEYIHEHTTPTYIHRDIKSSNILLDNSCRAKVADFGLTKLTESGTGSSTMPSRLVGTFGYMAPEYARFGDISAKSDVYSFGVVLFEIISAKDAIVHHVDQVSTTQGQRSGSHGLVTLVWASRVYHIANGRFRLVKGSMRCSLFNSQSGSKMTLRANSICLQFEGVLSDSANGKEMLCKLVDPALGDDYPLESVWKMATLAGACTREEPLLRPNMRVVVVALMTLSTSTQEWEADHGMEGVLCAR